MDITLYVFSEESKETEVFLHKPTECTIKFLPAPNLHKLLNNIGSKNSKLHKGFQYYLSSYTSTMSSELLKSLKSDKPDLIYQQEYESGRFDILVLLAKYLKIPLIAEYHGREPTFSNHLAGFGRFSKKCTIRMASRILCVNNHESKRASALQAEELIYEYTVERCIILVKAQTCFLCLFLLSLSFRWQQRRSNVKLINQHRVRLTEDGQ